MIETTELRAAKKFGVGYFIREQLEIRDWTQEDLAEIMGITLKHLNRIMKDKQPLTIDIARLLEMVFQSSAQYWLNIDSGYLLWKETGKTEKEKEAEIKKQIFERMPITDMIDKGWLKPYKSIEDLVKQVLDFWEMKSLDFSIIDNHLLPYLTRKSEAFNQYNASYALTWYRMAYNIAKKKRAKKYERENLKKLFNQIHTFTIAKDGINSFLSGLENCGVIFFVLPHLKKTYIDGASFLVNDNPALVYTGRYKRIDNFWFTIAHEIAHILEHLDNERPFIIDNFRSSEKNKTEDEANALAAKKLKHREISQYLEPYLDYLTMSKVEDCASKYEIHPAIIIGRLAYDGKISYKNQKIYNEDILKLVDRRFVINFMV